MIWLNSVLSRIADGTLLRAGYYGRLDCDAALEARDGDPRFVADWSQCFGEVEGRWKTAEVAEQTRAMAEDVRREAFLAVSRASGRHEIAGYVSDDLDLIVRGRLVGVRGGLLDRLWDVYDRGEFPVPPL